MKQTFIPLLFLLLFSESYGQENTDILEGKSIKVPLASADGGGPFGMGMTMVGNREKPDHPYFNAYPLPIDLPEEMSDYRQLHIIPNYIQFVHQSVAQGLIPEASWKGMLERYKGQDIIEEVCPDPIRSFVRLASRKNEDGSFDIWIDENANDQVEANEIHHYGLDLMASPKMWEELPVIPVDYETVKDGQVVQYKLPIRLNPFIYPSDILFNIDNHRQGSLTYGGQEYKIFVSNGFTADYYSQEGVKVFLEDDDVPYQRMDPQERNIVDYGEILFLGDEKFSVKGIDKSGTLLTLEKYPDDREWIGSQVGSKAYPIQSITLDSISFDLYNNKVTMIDFWGTWCAPCVEEIPFLKDAVAYFDAEEFELVGIANDNRENLIKFIDKNHLTWKQVMTKNGKDDPIDIAKLYGINAYPTTYLLDKDSKIILKNGGLRGYQLYQTLSKHLGKDPQQFLDFIALGDALLSLRSEGPISTVFLTGGIFGEEKIYAYRQKEEMIRGLTWPEGVDEISFDIRYMTKDRVLQTHSLSLHRDDVKAGRIEIVL